MHVVQCLTHSGVGGGQAVVFTLVKLLKHAHPELKLAVILPPGGQYVGRFQQLGVQVVEFPCDKISPVSILQFYKLQSTLKADVIHSHGKGAGFYSRIIPGKHLKARRIHSHHGFHPPKGFSRKRLYMLLERFLSSRMDCLVAVSESEANEVGRLFPLAARKITTIGNIVDRDEILGHSKDEPGRDVQDFLFRNDASFVVTMIGRDDPIKNYPLAFESCRLLIKRRREVAFMFVGIDNNVKKFDRVKSLHPESVLGIPFSDNTPPLVQRSDVLLITSKKEGSPLAVLEAFSLGKPVVGTNVEGIRDLVVHGHNGLLCEQSPESIADSLEQLMNNKELYNKLSRNALQTAGHMDKRAWTEKYYQLYKR